MSGRVATFALACLLAANPAAAQSVAAFYKGKQIDLYIGTPPGGGYDQYGRVLGRHMVAAHPRQSADRLPQHAGGRRPAGDEPRL